MALFLLPTCCPPHKSDPNILELFSVNYNNWEGTSLTLCLQTETRNQMSDIICQSPQDLWHAAIKASNMTTTKWRKLPALVKSLQESDEFVERWRLRISWETEKLRRPTASTLSHLPPDFGTWLQRFTSALSTYFWPYSIKQDSTQ